MNNWLFSVYIVIEDLSSYDLFASYFCRLDVIILEEWWSFFGDFFVVRVVKIKVVMVCYDDFCYFIRFNCFKKWCVYILGTVLFFTLIWYYSLYYKMY